MIFNNSSRIDPDTILDFFIGLTQT